tara:strand:- start:13134 stop:14270 length:1137 start_codon:yes stop_codon:yes gene_type:complete
MDKTWDVRTNDDLDDELTGKTVSFLGSFLPEGVDSVWSVEHFRWKLGEANPAGRGFMTVAVYSDDVIGVTSITRKRMWDGRSEVVAAEIGDTFSHPDFRKEGRAARPYESAGKEDKYLSRSVFGRLVSETRERAELAGISLIYGTPNNNSMPGYINRLGFFDYESHFNRYFVRPAPAALIKRLPPLAPLRGFLHRLDRTYSATLRSISTNRGRLRAEEIADAGDEINGLWQRLKDGMPFGPLRDAAYFKYRFLENPLARYRLWSVKQADSLCGVFVTRTSAIVGGQMTCHLADWLLDSDVKGIFRFVVAHMIVEHSCRNLESYGFWAERDWAARQGLLRIGCIGRHRVPIIFLDNKDSRQLDASGSKLNFTLATSDNI